MVTVHSSRNQRHDGSLRNATTTSIIAVVIVAFAAYATEVFPQAGSPAFLTTNRSSQNSVSTNQLLTPKKTLQAVERARKHILAGHIEQGQKEVARAFEISPHCALALAIQGAIHIETRQFEDAGKDFQDAIEADPSSGPAYLGLAMSLMGRERLRDALVPLDRATRFLPGTWLVYYETGITHLRLGDADAALGQMKYAERFTGTDPEKKSGTAYVRAAAYTVLGDYDRAKKYFEDAVVFDPNGFYATLARKRLEQLGALSINGK
jgi:tetratricopeptide (TPR) repeat protein